jgi:DNA-binding transcriptional MerR regulator
MEYTINKLAKLSGISTRTLRYYDEIGLLCPVRISDNNYRIYGQKEVDKLQQILFYKEMSVPLEEIGQILNASNFDKKISLESHLSSLLKRKNQIDSLIENVQKTISSMKGETIMSDKEKFEGFKQNMIDENETKYGKEVRGKYGDDVIDCANAKMSGMSEEQWQKSQLLSAEINEKLKQAFEQGNPSSDLAQEVCDLHRRWLCMFWKSGSYSKDAHMCLAKSYVDDDRFTGYYDKIAVGCAVFLKDAINIYCSK